MSTPQSIIQETPRDLRKKLSRAVVSHKALKDKQRENQYEHKILKNCLSSARANRDKWRLLYKESVMIVEKLQLELSTISQERDSLVSIIKTANLLDSEKKTLK